VCRPQLADPSIPHRAICPNWNALGSTETGFVGFFR
jgi:hypothetical protein